MSKEFEEEKRRLRDRRERETVKHDRWDRRGFDAIRAEIAALPTAAEDLLQITPTARAEIADAYYLFNKVQPELDEQENIRDDHRINLAVNEEVYDLPEYRELRRFTRGDRVASAMAAVKIEPELEIIFDKLKSQQEQAEELQRLRDELMEKLAEQLSNQGPPPETPEGDQPQNQGQGQQPGDQPSDQPGEPGGQGQGQGAGQSLQDEIDALRKAIEALENGIEQGLQDQQGSIQAQLSQALGGAADDARDAQQSAQMFGTEPGKLMRMPAKERLELAKKLNNPRIKAIAENFGPMANVAFSPRVRKVPTVPHEFMGITIGDDIDHLLVEQLAQLDDEDLEMLFLADFADQHLLQFKLRGDERIGKGGIILCEDGSGSMQGQRELWAKAVMLVLLNIAKKDGREFHLLHFGSRSELYEFPFKHPSDFTVNKIVQAAEVFCNGGTDFERPLGRALELLEEEYARNGRVNSDIVMLTDGQCSLNSQWIENFQNRLDKIGGVCWAILVGGDPKAEPLFSVCDGNTCSVQDLTAGSGREIKSVFSGIQRGNDHFGASKDRKAKRQQERDKKAR